MTIMPIQEANVIESIQDSGIISRKGVRTMNHAHWFSEFGTIIHNMEIIFFYVDRRKRGLLAS